MREYGFSLTRIFLYKDRIINLPLYGRMRVLVKTRILAYFMQCNDTSSCIIIYSTGAYLSSEKLLNFLSDLFIPPWLGKFFQIYDVEAGKCICELKNI